MLKARRLQEDCKPKEKKEKRIKKDTPLRKIEENGCGIDLGSKFHTVTCAVPGEKGKIMTLTFETFTSDLEAMINWLKKCEVKSACMEATGVYWMHLHKMLEDAGIKPVLIDGRHLKNVKGRKTDVIDSEWLYKIHSFGLDEGAFVPDNLTLELRTYTRVRENYVKTAARAINRMQKALIAMNIRIENVLNDISGKTGMTIIESILSGTRDPKLLASFRDSRCKSSEEEIEKALMGCYSDDQIFALKMAYDDYKAAQTSVYQCDLEIEKQLAKYETKQPANGCSEDDVTEGKNSEIEPAKKKNTDAKIKRHPFHFDLQKELIRISGVDLTQIPGIAPNTALTIIAELGLDMSHWKTAKHFCGYLQLAPNDRISGGKKLKSIRNKRNNRATVALRMSVLGLYRDSNKTAVGAYYLKKRSQKGPGKAITATASKLAKRVYTSLKTGKQYVEYGAEAYNEFQQDRQVKKAKRILRKYGYTVAKNEQASAA